MLEPLSRKINAGLKIVDCEFFDNISHLQEVACKKHASLRLWQGVDPLLFEGRELLYNRCSGPHKDSQDPPLGYAVLFTAGTYTSGGSLVVKKLKLRIRLLPGDAIFLRGRVLEHEIEPWDGGQRISIPHFTHTSLWRDLGLEYLVDL